MGLFDKLFVVEETETSRPVAVPMESNETQAVSAEVSSTESVVSSIYAQNDLVEEADSIYAVSKLMETLPKEMSTPKMQQTISGILAVTQKSIPDLLADGHKRIEVLTAACNAVIAERTAEIECANADIEQLKLAIEAAEKVIKHAEDVVEATKHQVEDEVAVIEKLLKFSEGMVAAE